MLVTLFSIVLNCSCKYHLNMLCLYLLGHNCLHLTFNPYLISEIYSRKYKKQPNIVIHACKNRTEKMNLMKMCGPQIRLCLFTFRPIASKQLNILTTINSPSWLGGAVVMILSLSFCFVVFTFCPKAHYLSQTLRFLLHW